MRLRYFVKALDQLKPAFRPELFVLGNRFEPVGDLFQGFLGVARAQLGEHFFRRFGIGERMPALSAQCSVFECLKQLDHAPSWVRRFRFWSGLVPDNAAKSMN